MQHRFQRTGLALDGFLVVSVEITGESVQILLRSRSPSGLCPSCGRPSRRVQSRYLRRPADLPLCGRRTQRMETIVHYLGLALGGRPAAAFVERLMVPVSNDTLLRVVRRRTADQNDELTVIGSDDFAFRRGQTYGTIICDLKRRRPVTLLPDRALDTSRAWLAVHQSISIVARDRGGGYGEVIAKALPDAEQVADRWHLMENSSRAFLDAVGASSGPLYATAFLRAGTAVSNRLNLDGTGIAEWLAAASQGIQDRGRAAPGDKTMIDAWVPAVEAASEAAKAGKSTLDVLIAARDGAEVGMKATAAMESRRGRSAKLGERSIGHIDPGAASTFVTLRAMAEALQDAK